MNLKLIESFVDLIELDAFANKEDIVKGLNSAIKVTKEQAELTDEEILKVSANKFLMSEHRLVLLFARELLRKAQEK
jgi:hypothetical protein